MRRLAGVFSDTQLAHQAKRNQMYFSPEAKALRSDPDIGPAQEHALLDHVFKGYRKLVPNKSGQLALATDNFPELSSMNAQELNQLQIDEVKNALNNVDYAGEFKTLEPEDREYVRSLIIKHIPEGSINAVGRAGAEGRTYPKDFDDKELAGTEIPAIYAPGQLKERGISLLLDVAEGADQDTGVGLYATSLAAMHKIPAAVRPDLVTAIDNIKMGQASMNQSDGKRVGLKLEQSRNKRLLNLQDERFYLENGVPNTQRGGYEGNYESDNIFMKELDKIIVN